MLSAAGTCQVSMVGPCWAVSLPQTRKIRNDSTALWSVFGPICRGMLTPSVNRTADSLRNIIRSTYGNSSQRLLESFKTQEDRRRSGFVIINPYESSYPSQIQKQDLIK